MCPPSKSGGLAELERPLVEAGLAPVLAALPRLIVFFFPIAIQMGPWRRTPCGNQIPLTF